VALFEQLWLFLSTCVFFWPSVALLEQPLLFWAAVALFEKQWLFLSSCGSFWAAVALFAQLRVFLSSSVSFSTAVALSAAVALFEHLWLFLSSCGSLPDYENVRSLSARCAHPLQRDAGTPGDVDLPEPGAPLAVRQLQQAAVSDTAAPVNIQHLKKHWKGEKV
jgi:hypothetical protein